MRGGWKEWGNGVIRKNYDTWIAWQGFESWMTCKAVIWRISVCKGLIWSCPSRSALGSTVIAWRAALLFLASMFGSESCTAENPSKRRKRKFKKNLSTIGLAPCSLWNMYYASTSPFNEAKDGARYRVRTCDPYSVSVVLYRWANRACTKQFVPNPFLKGLKMAQGHSWSQEL